MKKKWISYLLIFLLSFSFVFQFVKADSGWDVDYDTSSSSSSSSSSSGSSSSIDFSWDNPSDRATLITVFSALVILFIIAHIVCRRSDSSPNSFSEMSEEQIHAIDPDMNIEEFKSNVYDTFIKVQNA